MENTRKKPSTEYVRATIGATLGKYCRPKDSLAVAFSGGLDSSVLLHVLSHHAAAWGFGPVSAIHVNHGLSPRADQWGEHCAEVCKQWNVPLETKRVAVVRSGEGLEAAAREARYQALSETQTEWVALGHHQDDQAETLLFNLLRGAGLKGLGAMSAARGSYLRPMLDLPHDAITSYARATGIRWIEDESNASENHTRNFLRHRIFPVLRERFPAVSSSFARSAQISREAGALLDDLACLDQGAPGPLSVGRLEGLSPARALNLLAYKLREASVRIPSRAQLQELLRQLLEASEDAAPRFVFDRHAVMRFRGHVYAVPHPFPHPEPVIWSGQETVQWSESTIRIGRSLGQGISEQAARESCVMFSCRRGGESFRLRLDGPECRLKDLLREAGLPPWLRNSLPLMFVGDELVWVPGVGIADEYRCGPEEMGISLEFDGLNW